eukprot:247915-Rhodomonas_salina.2
MPLESRKAKTRRKTTRNKTRKELPGQGGTRRRRNSRRRKPHIKEEGGKKIEKKKKNANGIKQTDEKKGGQSRCLWLRTWPRRHMAS